MTSASNHCRRRDVRAAPLQGRDRRSHLGVVPGRAVSCVPAISSSGRCRTTAIRRRSSAIAWERAKGLREMAAKAPNALCPGHGGPVIGEQEKIVHMLTETATFLDTVVSRTLAAMENGSPPHVDIVTGIELPKSQSPWLQPVYDDTEFLVRNVIRFYGGWWSGRPSRTQARAARQTGERDRKPCRWRETLAERARRSSRRQVTSPRLPSGRLCAGSRAGRRRRAGQGRGGL